MWEHPEPAHCRHTECHCSLSKVSQQGQNSGARLVASEPSEPGQVSLYVS